MRGVDEMALTLVRHQRRDVADDRRVVRQPEGLMDVDRWRCGHVFDVDAFVDRDRPLGGHAVGDEHLADGFRRGDEAVHLPVLPSRKRIAAEVKVDAARRDERRRAPARSLGGRRPHRQRQRSHRDAVRVVSVNDVGSEPLDDPRQPPGRGEVHLGARRERE